MTIRIKICGITSTAEARLAIRYGASLLGLVSETPSSPDGIDDAEIAHIAATLPPGVTATLLTRRSDAAGILDQQRRCGVGAIQLSAATTPEVRQAIRDGAPGVQLLQVVRIAGPASLAEVHEATAGSHAVLLVRASRPGSASPQHAPDQGRLSGLRSPPDWSLSRQLVRAVGVPVFLSGGLSGDTVRAAIRAVRPYGVDAGAELRTDGSLDPAKLAVFTSGVDHAAHSGAACVAWPG